MPATGERLLELDVQACSRKWAACCGASNDANLRLEREYSTVHFHCPVPGRGPVALSVVFLSAGSYPKSPAFADCTSSEEVYRQLRDLNTDYKESAALPAVLTDIFRRLRSGEDLSCISPFFIFPTAVPACSSINEAWNLSCMTVRCPKEHRVRICPPCQSVCQAICL